MRKIMFLSLLVLMTAALISCSSGAKQVPAENAASQPAAAEAAESTPEVDTIEELEHASGMEINVSMGEMGENMSLPESFPKDVLPLPEDANIVNVNDNADTKSVSIIFKTGKNFDEALAYCQDIMKDGTITVEDKKDDSYILMGSKDKYSIMITVSKYNGENISILFNVTPQ
jgi:hypothetical protein